MKELTSFLTNPSSSYFELAKKMVENQKVVEGVAIPSEVKIVSRHFPGHAYLQNCYSVLEYSFERGLVLVLDSQEWEKVDDGYHRKI